MKRMMVAIAKTQRAAPHERQVQAGMGSSRRRMLSGTRDGRAGLSESGSTATTSTLTPRS